MVGAIPTASIATLLVTLPPEPVIMMEYFPALLVEILFNINVGEFT
jgi:hypothetical protein